ncbi:MAG: capsule assembly Wzi family protein [Acidobacteriota bacterium]|nr:capsule assembly Wzi family protein [Acidobacteriota bacterium]
MAGVFLPAVVLLLVAAPLRAQYAQYGGEHAVSVETLFSSGDGLPFWLLHNQSGKYGNPGDAVQVLELQSRNRLEDVFGKGVDLEFGADFVAPHGEDSDVHFNELYAKARFWKLFKLEGGWFREERLLDGLSSSNTNLDRTLNARPYPKVKIATDGFVNPFSASDRITFRIEYDEGLLGDDRVVKGAHLHHKSFYLGWDVNDEYRVTVGLDHFVMWGGRHPVYGELPGFDSYLRYVLGRAGDDNFAPDDQANIAGNQLGSYNLRLDVDKDAYALAFYASHPFEDRSGMRGDNWRDNLLGASFRRKKEGLLETAVYEFMNTRNQSGAIHDLSNHLNGNDNYFNHGVYSSGYTYMGYTLASPLFSPLTTSGGFVTGIGNNRVLMHHVGLLGSVGEHMDWDARLTFTRNLGRYAAPYAPPEDQFSSYVRLRYSSPRLPVELAVALAGDVGALYPNRFGAMVSVSKTFRTGGAKQAFRD